MTTTSSSTSLTSAAFRDMGRLRFVATTIARHGFGEIILRTPLARLLGIRKLPAPDSDLGTTPAAVRFTRLLAALGPTFIKLGQILSMRHDLFPAEYIRALQTLQDKAPPLPLDVIKQVVEVGLGKPVGELFASFEEKPLAAASIAQTHRATTHEGAAVVLKVQRPGIENTMRGDLNLLYMLAQLLEAGIDEARLIGVSNVIVEFERGLLQELNFDSELAHLVEAEALLDKERRVRVPKPYPLLSCRTVLTMEFFEGKSLRTLTPGSEMAKHAVEEIVHAAFKQVFIDGYFHGDPHAGNILINEDGDLCMIDLGLMGRLSPTQRDDLVTLAFAIASNDTSTIARLMLTMGTPTQRVVLSELKAEISRFRSSFLLVKNVTEVDSTKFVEAFADAAGRFRIKLATEYTTLTKASAAIEGIIRQLHPTVDILGISQIYAQKIMGERYAPQRILSEALGGATGIFSMVRHLPTQVDQLLHDLETGNLQVRPVTSELDQIPARLHTLASRIAMTAFATSMSLCAAIVLPQHKDELYAFRIVVAVLAALCASGAWTTLWWWHFIGRGKPLAVRPLMRFFRR